MSTNPLCATCDELPSTYLNNKTFITYVPCTSFVAGTSWCNTSLLHVSSAALALSVLLESGFFFGGGGNIKREQENNIVIQEN